MVDKENAVGSGFLHISPPPKLAPSERKLERARPEDATLILKKFAPIAWPSFGDVPLGTSATANLELVNPSTAEARLTLENFPTAKGFVVEGLVEDNIVVLPGEKSTLILRWTPTVEGKINEKFVLKWQGKNKLQAKMLGTGVMHTESKTKGKGRRKGKGEPLSVKFQQQQPRTQSTAPNTANVTKSHSGTKSRAQLKAKQPQRRSKPVVSKKPRRAAAKSSTQPTSTNTNQKSKMVNKARHADHGGDQWMDKQQRCLTKLMRHVLAPSNLVESSKMGNDEPTHIAMVEDELKQHRLRAWTFQLMTTPEMKNCIGKLKEQVEAGHIAMVRDVSLHKNVHVHNHCLECVMNYTPEWLRLGLEAVFNETCISNDEQFLSTFVKQKLLFDEDKATQSGVNERQSVLNQHSTLMMLTLVYVLDHAKTARMLDNNPSLFKINGTIKSSSEMLRHFFDGVLSGGGDLERQLRHINYRVEHVQSALAEYPFAVSNIATDLQDGVVLCKLAEILTNKSSIMENVKCPAKSEAVMKHNISIALQALQKSGCNVQLCAKPEDIIDGRQDRTLSLLWNVMMHWQILDMIDTNALSSEVDRVSCRHRDSMSSRRLSTSSDSGIVDTDVYMNSDKLGLLLLWCRVVCARYGVRVHNFTSSFSDGRVLCLLVHHYHPEMLPLNDISGKPKKQVNLDPAEFEDDSNEGNIESRGENFINFFIPLDSPDDGEEPDVALECKMSNFNILQSRIMELGGIPNIITSRDMVSGAPDEKVVITYVTYLSSRLLDIRVQVEAACTISRHWKNRSAQVALRKTSAAMCIQQAARARFGFKQPINQDNKTVAAVHQIQRVWRGFSTREQILPMIRAQLVAVDVLQATFRACIQRRAYQLVILAVTKLQSVYRGKAARHQFVQTTQAAQTVQRLYRSYRDRSLAAPLKLRLQDTQAILELEASTLIQTQFRARSHCNNYTKLRSATIKVQAAVRCSQARKAYAVLGKAAIAGQTAWKGYVARKTVATLKTVVRFQALWRGTVIRRSVQQDRSAVVTIQAAYRAHCDRMSYHSVVQAVVRIQSIARTRSANRHHGHARSSCVAIQAAIRGYQTRKAFAAMQQCRTAAIIAAVTTIQTQFRARSHCNNYTKLRSATIKVQAAVRCSQARKAYTVICKAAIAVQTAQRRYAAYKALQAIRAVVRFQALWRGVVARQTLEQFGIAATVIQTQFRARSHCNNYTKLRSATIKMQAAVRCSQARRAYAAICKAAIAMQIEQSSQQQEQTAKLQLDCRKHADDMNSRISEVNTSEVVQYVDAATQIQRACRGWAGRKRALRQLTDIVCVQSIFRGHMIRQSTDKDVTAVRQRLRELSANRNERDTLEHRTEQALAIVATTAHLDKIIPAIGTLDMATRWSTLCCKSVVDEDAVHIVLRLVRACNRSTTHMDLLKSALNVLHNLCKHRSTCKAVFAVSASVEIFAELMQLYRDKPAIFIQACTILRTMCKINSHRKAIVSMKDIVKRTEGIYRLLELKYKREAEHCAHLHNADSDTRPRESLKKLQAQLRGTAKLMEYMGVGIKSKDPECRKLRL